MLKPYQYWEFRSQEVVFMVIGLLLGGAFGFGIFAIEPAPPWWFLGLPRRLDFDSWQEYHAQGGYEMFWLQSTWGWAIVCSILGLVISNVALRKKEL